MTRDEQPGLFDTAPAAAAPPKRHTGKTTYTRYKPASRTSCDDCRTRLHTLGIARAPFPRPARWRRTTPEGATSLLCDECKNTRKGADQ